MKRIISTIMIAFLAVMSLPFSVFAEEKVNWVKGGQTVQVGDKFASIDLDPKLVYLNAEDTVKVQSELGNFKTGKEIGSIYSANPNERWFVVLEYDEVGHISDEEKNDIDADAILQSYKDGTEQNNKDRQPEEQLHVVGWDVKPFYEETTHKLQWSMLAEDAKKNPLINYNVQILTREGFVSFTLVSDPSRLAQDKKTLNDLIVSKFKVNEGNRYEDFNEETDKVAEYGLTGLVLGGLGLAAVAKKAGLFALILVFLKKGWVLIVAVLVFLFKFVKGKLGRKNEGAQQPETTQEPHPNPNDETTSIVEHVDSKEKSDTKNDDGSGLKL